MSGQPMAVILSNLRKNVFSYEILAQNILRKSQNKDFLSIFCHSIASTSLEQSNIRLNSSVAFYIKVMSSEI